MERKKLAIIGAGASGLPAIRHALDYDVDVTCFEATGFIGGLWRYKPEDTDGESSVMKTTVINTSKEMTAYSDFPPDANLANFMHNSEMYKYLKSYADHFDLHKYIKLHHKILNVSRSQDHENTGKWDVRFLDSEGNEQMEVFDGVLLGTGHHTTPYMPKPWPGQETFNGKITHSHSYKDHIGYEDKTVVIVGVGNSGGDIAVELSRIAKQVYLVTRRGTWVFNRIYDYGEPFDIALNRRWAIYLQGILPLSFSAWYMQRSLNQRFDHEKYGLKPKHHVFGAHPTVNDELPNRIASGTVKLKPNLKRFQGNDIEFEDGTVVRNVDEVILSTGFSYSFPVAEEGKLIPVTENESELYQYMFPQNISRHNSLAVLGLVQPFGSIMPISELQARVFLENFAGTHKLPSREQMKENIAKKREDMKKRYVSSRRHTIQVDGTRYMDELASLIGVLPSWSEMFLKDPLFTIRLIMGPNLPYTYRLVGPHPWTGAKQAIENVAQRVQKPLNPNVQADDLIWNRKNLLVLIVIFVLFYFIF